MAPPENGYVGGYSLRDVDPLKPVHGNKGRNPRPSGVTSEPAPSNPGPQRRRDWPCLAHFPESSESDRLAEAVSGGRVRKVSAANRGEASRQFSEQRPQTILRKDETA